MPDIVNIRVLGDRPAQDRRLEAPFVDEVVDEGRPFQDADLDSDAHVGKLLLDDFGALRPHFVTLVGDDFKGEGSAFPVQDAVAVAVLPARLGQEGFRPPGIVGIFLHPVVVGPGSRLVRPCSRLAQAEQDAADHLLLVHGIGDGLPDPSVGEQGVFQVVAHIDIGEGQITVLTVLLAEEVVFRLAGELEGRQTHLVDTPRP